MPRFKITLIASLEYDVNLNNYPEECKVCLEKALESDIEDVMDCPELILESSNVQVEYKGEIIHE